MSERLVVVRTCLNDLEAAMLKAELEASGIPVVTSGANLLPIFFRRAVRLAVPEWAVEDAVALLRPFGDDEEQTGALPNTEEQPPTIPVADGEERSTGREERPRTRPACGQELPRRRPPP